jgi:hypothetical protein
MLYGAKVSARNSIPVKDRNHPVGDNPLIPSNRLRDILASMDSSQVKHQVAPKAAACATFGAGSAIIVNGATCCSFGLEEFSYPKLKQSGSGYFLRRISSPYAPASEDASTPSIARLLITLANEMKEITVGWHYNPPG